MTENKHYLSKLRSVVSSTKFFIATIVLFILQAGWIAFSAIYPLPFDEYYHFGLIKIYAQQWTPFISEQLDNASLYGDITRYPSYLYHYLMSFPYRVLSTLISSEMTIIICLRLFNIALVVFAIVLFRKLLLRWKFSKPLTHITLLVFMVTPIVPFLAAHINYDNLMLLFAPIVFLLAGKIIDSKKLNIKDVILFFSVGLLNSLIKINFFPIFLVTTVYLLVLKYLQNRQDLGKYLDLRSVNKKLDYKFLAILLFFATTIFLAGERFGYNLMVYGYIRPDCATVQSQEICKDFMPWYRNQQIRESQEKQNFYGNPVSYSQYWVSRMARGYYASFSHTPTNVLSEHEPFGPIVLKPQTPLPITLGSIFFGITILLGIIYRKKLWANNKTRFIVFLIIGYTASLWFFNYQSYLSLGSAQAIQARYTYPLMILAIAIATQLAFWAAKNKKYLKIICLVLLVVYVLSGGITSWIIRSDQDWYWQNSQIINTNQNVQNILKKVIPN